ncbi:hypothetical protein NDU88_009880 [Pleurodeles waltl]|uniref:Uncharacterized protein n=1 Tax=Pleurodeles waltl TaxID=8319 RepID=A0AAV7PWH0_PLEWA|nr:hypothetical protein NDU88_009880 [Pleurodeles waltl]
MASFLVRIGCSASCVRPGRLEKHHSISQLLVLVAHDGRRNTQTEPMAPHSPWILRTRLGLSCRLRLPWSSPRSSSSWEYHSRSLSSQEAMAGPLNFQVPAGTDTVRRD